MTSVPGIPRVSIRIVCPNQGVRVVRTRLTAKISALQVVWPERHNLFIFAGTKLAEDRTLADYEIRDQESILALSESNSSDANHWISWSRDIDSLNEEMRFMVSRTTSSDAFRIRDLRLIRMQRQPRHFLRECSSFTEPDSPVTAVMETRLSAEVLSSPAVEALPLLWNSEAGQIEKNN
jgi:hypothetical protein